MRKNFAQTGDKKGMNCGRYLQIVNRMQKICRRRVFCMDVRLEP